MPKKLFSFSAESFEVSPLVEDFMRARKAISIDFGASIYLSAESTSAILTELVAKHAAGSQIWAVAAPAESQDRRVDAEDEKTRMELEITDLRSKLSSLALEADLSTRRAKEYSGTIDSLRLEIEKLREVITSKKETTPASSHTPESKEFRTNEIQTLRMQHADAIASLKVLEQENEELLKELESLRERRSEDQKALKQVPSTR